MKKTLIIVIGLLLSAGIMGQVRVSNFETRQNGNRTEIAFDAQIDKKATNSNHKLIMTPVLYNGNQAVELSPIVVETRKTKIMDARTGVQPLPNALLTENGRRIRYTAAVDNMYLSDPDLRFNFLSVGCCSEETLAPLAVTTTNAPPAYTQPAYVPPPATQQQQPAYVPPSAPPTERPIRIGGMVIMLIKNAPELRNVDGRAGIRTLLNKREVGFAVNSTQINLYAFNNSRVLNEIISTLRSSPNVLQGGIEITGYASPEGAQAANYALARNRALAVRNYILDNVPYLRPANFDIVNGGENWEGLYKLVEESRMPGRWQVLDIIETTPPDIDYFNNISRKKMLMDLNGGQTWRYMLANFFPRLRSAATVTIYAPGERGTATQESMFPARNTELINRAIDMLGERNSGQALQLLLEVENDPRAWNPLGVCYLLEYNMNRAKEYFQKAAEAGYSEAKGNLEQMNNN